MLLLCLQGVSPEVQRFVEKLGKLPANMDITQIWEALDCALWNIGYCCKFSDTLQADSDNPEVRRLVIGLTLMTISKEEGQFIAKFLQKNSVALGFAFQ